MMIWVFGLAIYWIRCLSVNAQFQMEKPSVISKVCEVVYDREGI